MAKLDFWYSIGSTYSYLTVMRLPDLAQRRGCDVRWRPFNVRHVMTVQKVIACNTSGSITFTPGRPAASAAADCSRIGKVR